MNESKEMVKDKDLNGRSQESISFFEGLFVFIYNYLLFIPGIILYYQHKKKGYTKKARQIAIIIGIDVVLFLSIVIINRWANLR
jgi:uncharacterized protein YybS (DUF2232 family)